MTTKQLLGDEKKALMKLHGTDGAFVVMTDTDVDTFAFDPKLMQALQTYRYEILNSD